MQKNYLKYLTSVSKKFAKQYDIFDIILYGSAVKGKEQFRDTDILLLFKEQKLKKRAEIAQELKEILSKNIENIDIKTINLKELFEKDFLAKQSIIIEGYSLLYYIHFCKRLGFNGYMLITYNLKNLNHNQKTRFTYSLIGRNEEGIIKKLNIEYLGKGAMMVPSENSLIFEEFLQKWEIDYKKKYILKALL